MFLIVVGSIHLIVQRFDVNVYSFKNEDFYVHNYMFQYKNLKHLFILKRLNNVVGYKW
jgi:uncharacterized membrane protein